ncbi:efflux RND transporter permease subunit [Microscilla marina]|uniref:AcrB/AcrD/AcrF family protein n=1 Tax=Microscilla marina ATCC 23134 TaxID=313606 RepID=A2A047_MICM2|nr:efflux RND transporter permease subunit [Microscilla marina]EAY23985.1 AcrB/AcrD/AcrF family protein [Microscilla marina ATCC 23134]
MNITELSIKNSRITIVILLVILLAGFSTFTKMPRAEDPGFIVRVASIVTVFPGASPERVEMLVSDKLEKVIQEIPELNFVESTSKPGVSIIKVNIKESEKKLRPIWDKLRRKVNKAVASGELPDNIRGPLVNDEYGDVFGIILGITGEGFDYAEMKKVADEVRDELLRLPNASKVEIFGAQEERIFVEYNNTRLAELGLSTYILQQNLASRNIIIPGGEITVNNERILLEPSGNFESIEDLRKTVITLPKTNEGIYLGDIAHVYRGYIDPARSKMKVNGTKGLALAVSLIEGGNIIDLGKDVEQTMARLQQQYPHGIDFSTIAYQHTIVDNKVNDFVNNLLQSVAIVLAVMLLFLGFKTGFIVASLIPMTMMLSLLLMSLMGIGLDQVSLASLVIALGMLVDNAIVMSESIMVRMEQGEKPMDAALASAKELKVSLLTSSLTTSAAFLPIFLAKSNVGEFTSSLFKVVSIALLSSWVLAITMIPMLCVYFLKVKRKDPNSEQSTRFQQLYRRFLLFNLKRPALFIVTLTIVFLGSMATFKYVPKIFFPPSDRNLVTVQLEMPVGTAIDKTEAVVDQLEKYMKDSLQVNAQRKEGVENWGAWIGEGAPKYALNYNPETRSSEVAYLLVNTTSGNNTREISDKIDAFCFAHFPDLKVKANPINMGPPVRDPVEVRISGKDPKKIFKIVDAVKAKIASVNGTRNISDNWGGRTKKLVVKVNQARARMAGVTSQDIAISLQTELSGFNTSEFREGDQTIPITMRTVASDRQDLSKLENLSVYAQRSGQTVPLKQVADLVLEWQPSKIIRRNRFKTVSVTAALEGGFTAKGVVGELVPWLKAQQKTWDLGYYFEIGGAPEKSDIANKSITEQLPIAGFIILILLVGQFNSIRKTAIILIAIPLGLVGVVLGLLGAGSYFGFMTLLGVISLAGIVINNAIVLLDRIQLEINELGKPPQEAIIAAAQQRFRPILLTTATTVLGLLPLWFGGGLMWEPMAIAIIFGLLFATVLTLVFVPVMYRVLFRVSYKGF